MSPMDFPRLTETAMLSGKAPTAGAGETDAGKAKLREVARQFESLFTHMLLKNMRSASLGEGFMDSEQSRFYRDMFDEQLAGEMAQGQGLGVADMLVRQLGGEPAVPPRRVRRSYALAASDQTVSTVQSTPEVTDRDRAESFVRRLLPHARKAATLLGIEPQFLLAQAALETGWGKRSIKTAEGQDSHNLFGIKANAAWKGERARATTHEFLGGVATRIDADFRAYGSESDSFADYANLLLHSNRYREALNQGQDGDAYFSALQKGGYATDPDYAGKIMRIATGSTMKNVFAGLKIP